MVIKKTIRVSKIKSNYKIAVALCMLNVIDVSCGGDKQVSTTTETKNLERKTNEGGDPIVFTDGATSHLKPTKTENGLNNHLNPLVGQDNKDSHTDPTTPENVLKEQQSVVQPNIPTKDLPANQNNPAIEGPHPTPSEEKKMHESLEFQISAFAQEQGKENQDLYKTLLLNKYNQDPLKVQQLAEKNIADFFLERNSKNQEQYYAYINTGYKFNALGLFAALLEIYRHGSVELALQTIYGDDFAKKLFMVYRGTKEFEDYINIEALKEQTKNSIKYQDNLLIEKVNYSVAALANVFSNIYYIAVIELNIDDAIVLQFIKIYNENKDAIEDRAASIQKLKSHKDIYSWDCMPRRDYSIKTLAEAMIENKVLNGIYIKSVLQKFFSFKYVNAEPLESIMAKYNENPLKYEGKAATLSKDSKYEMMWNLNSKDFSKEALMDAICEDVPGLKQRCVISKGLLNSNIAYKQN